MKALAEPQTRAEAATGQVVCHSLDLLGRTLCGARLTGAIPPHPIGDCAVDGHPRCAACDTLMMCDGDDEATDALEAA